jgi:hypothetical protein
LSRLYTLVQIHSPSSSYARQLTLCMLAFWSCEGVVFLVHSSSPHFTAGHVFPLPLSGANWRSLSLLWGSGPPLPKMASPSTGSAHTPFLGSNTTPFCHVYFIPASMFGYTLLSYLVYATLSCLIYTLPYCMVFGLLSCLVYILLSYLVCAILLFDLYADILHGLLYSLLYVWFKTVYVF